MDATTTRRHADTVGLTQTQLAACLGVSERTLARVRAAGGLPAEIREITIGSQRRYLLPADGAGLPSIPAALAVARRVAEASIPAKEVSHE